MLATLQFLSKHGVCLSFSWAFTRWNFKRNNLDSQSKDHTGRMTPVGKNDMLFENRKPQKLHKRKKDQKVNMTYFPVGSFAHDYVCNNVKP